jgi:hypothetical protein
MKIDDNRDSEAFLFIVTISNVNIHTMDWKLVLAYFVYAGSSISICLPKALTTICLCSINSIFSTKAIAFVVDFSIQY